MGTGDWGLGTGDWGLGTGDWVGYRIIYSMPYLAVITQGLPCCLFPDTPTTPLSTQHSFAVLSFP
ncbi:hypothetical protein [Nostoc sp. CMAA1605]|uniref:hypothetical protein n=1 Tax=Nostoc sp. CMAA1605 TaxID=2055159 RepID=UPI001F35ABD3|nr:hypothetical protein [Nostoc sp. CMAA1605]